VQRCERKAAVSRIVAVLGLVALLADSNLAMAGQGDTDVVAAVRAAISTQNLSRADAIIVDFRSTHGTTPEAIEALSWLGRGALAAKQLDKAAEYAIETTQLVVAALKTRKLKDDAHLQTALGASIETRALVLVQQGARSDGVALLRAELEKYRETPIHKRLAKNLNLLTLEGHRALPLETKEYLDRPVPSLARLKGKVVLLFFWAHWCPDCKAEGPIIAKLLDKYRSQRLVIVAPTQLYGYVEGGRPAGPAEELRYILQVRDRYYGFLRNQPVPVTETNHNAYGVSSTPTIVLLDQNGIVRTYHPGRMTEAELEAAVRPLLGSSETARRSSSK
jgi:thiol-disulfide isomerase/thioredoxin